MYSSGVRFEDNPQMVRGKTSVHRALASPNQGSGEAGVHYVQTKGDNLRRISVGFPSTSPMLKLLLLE